MVEFKLNIGSRLKEIRDDLNLTQESVAEVCKITTEYYRSIENGKKIPSVDIINCLHNCGWDIDYVLIGCKSGESVFAKYLSGCNESKKNDICNILLYKMKLVMAESNINTDEYAPIIGESKSMSWNANERARGILLNEIGRSKNQNHEMAKIMGVSTRTVERWVDGTSTLKTGMVLSIYEKFQYPPSYILYGELNSNSKCDIYFNELDKDTKKDILELAGVMSKCM